MSTVSSSINLGLPQLPSITDPNFFEEFLTVYNALRILASSIDQYTGEGNIVVEVQVSTAQVEAQVAALKKEVDELKEQLHTINLAVNWSQPGEIGSIAPNSVAATTLDVSSTTNLLDLSAGISKLGDTTTSKFGCNGKAAQASYALPASATDLTTAIALANGLKAMAINNGTGA